MIDREVARLLWEAEDRAVTMLRLHIDALRHLADQLVERETVDGNTVAAALAEYPGHTAPFVPAIEDQRPQTAATAHSYV